MAIAQYTDSFWFPSGALAVNISAVVFPFGSSVPATLYTDVTGTAQLPNPLSTSGTGLLAFWAEEGEYWIHLGAESFRVSVGSPGTLDVFEVAASAAISTGIIAGGNVSIASPTAITITEIVGYVVDHTTDPFRPATTRIHQATQTVALAGASLTRTVTWWMINAAGTLIQQGSTPTNTQRRTHILIAVTSLDVATQTLFGFASVPQILPQPMNQFLDLSAALGSFLVSGGETVPNGANLSINSSAGFLFQPGWAYGSTPDDPHAAPIVAASPTQFVYGLQGTTVFPPVTTLIDAANYDVGGVLTPVGGGVNTATVQRVFKFSGPAVQTAIQYGQSTYSTLTNAVNAIGTGPFVINPGFRVGVLVAYIAVIRTATDLSDPAKCQIIQAGKFARP